MAQIVLIDTGTLREGLNSIGDVVSVHDDNVVLGPSYDTFKIIRVPGTAQEVIDLINSKIPVIKPVFRSKAPAGEWSDERPEEAMVWNDNGTWRMVEAPPKYQVNIAVTKELENAVADKALADTSKLSILGSASTSNLATSEANKAVMTIVKAVDVVDVVEAATT